MPVHDIHTYALRGLRLMMLAAAMYQVSRERGEYCRLMHSRLFVALHILTGAPSLVTTHLSGFIV